MRIYAGVTDHDWFDYLRSLRSIDEVNFWQPSPVNQFRALQKGDLFLFKLHRSPRTHNQDIIAGGGIFASFSIFPISLAWEAFEERNGAASYSEMRRRLIHYRRIADNPQEDFKVGCIILTQPFFFDESMWFPVPDWRPSIVRGKAKGYELDQEAGKFIWKNLQRAWQHMHVYSLDKEAQRIEEERARYGKETSFRPRLGQGGFRIAVTEAYRRACAITEEHTLPALEAAHIKPYGDSGPHAVHNGLLLRSDFHRLFDKGYITVTPEHRIEVSKRIKEEYKNGRCYYPFHGQRLHHLPATRADYPAKDLLIWHNENLFKG
jgi:putative restriction endonuclease